MEIMQIIFIAAITEAIVETFKKIHDFQCGAIIALIVAITLCFLTKTCILCLAKITILPPQVDYIVAGILCSRGSNFLHDFLKILENLKNNTTKKDVIL
jgi:hypothetical protein